MDRSGLVKQFEKAGLKLELTKKPFVKVSDDGVFQMDVGRSLNGNRRDEWIRIWPGADENQVEVRNIDSKICQLVLAVKEGERMFEVDIPKTWGKQRGDIVVKEYMKGKQKMLTIKRRTPKAMRFMLVGRDERQLFIATLPRHCTTVKEAHEVLKGSTVTMAEGRVSGKTIRQGEWFFLHVSEEEAERIKQHIKLFGTQKERPLGNLLGVRQGKPHVVTEAVVIAPKKLEHGHSVQGRSEVYVRGKVRHEDHKTVSFKDWRKVIKNAEGGGGNGVYWID